MVEKYRRMAQDDDLGSKNLQETCGGQAIYECNITPPPPAHMFGLPPNAERLFSLSSQLLFIVYSLLCSVCVVCVIHSLYILIAFVMNAFISTIEKL